ncbi:MAG: DUF2029 domain-containing protein [Proteobacteria bacterium]|nr:DUF2029 domain-containing protein [Pseudomonadota bacterium]
MKIKSIDEHSARYVRLGLLTVLFGACLWAGRHGGGGDFFVLRNSVRAAWSGDYANVYLKNSSGPFFYPPFALVFFGFFSCVENDQVSILLNVFLHSASFCVFWWGIKYFWPELFSLPAFKRWFLCFCFAIAPLHLDFMGQNINLPLAALLIGIEALSQKAGRCSDFFCGLFSSLIAWVKVFPGFVTATYFVSGSLQMRLGILVGSLLGFFSPYLFFGKGGVYLSEEFIKILSVYHDKNGITGNAALNLPGWIARWGRYFISANVLSVLQIVIPVICAVLFWGWILFRLKRRNRVRERAIWALAMSLTVFLNSASRPDYFMFYVPLFACLMSEWPQLMNWVRIMVVTAFVLIALTQQGIVGHDLNIVLQYLRIPVIGMALLILAAVSCLNVNKCIPSNNNLGC